MTSKATVVLLLASLVPACLSVNVLVFLPGTTSLERTSLEYLAFQMARRNHRVSTFKGVVIPEVKHLVRHRIHGVKEIELKLKLAPEVYQAVSDWGNDRPWRTDASYAGAAVEYSLPRWTAYVNGCAPILNSDLIEKLRADPYDVAIVYAENACYLALVHALSIPYIYLDLSGLSDEVSAAAGLPFQPAQFPSSHTTYSTQMSMLERLSNVWTQLEEHFVDIPYLNGLLSARHRHMDGPITELFRNDYEMRKRFSRFPDISEIRRQAEVYFVNSDPLVEFYRRALPANVVPIGGFHVDYVKPLYEPWNTTMAAAADGVVVCSLGTRANSSAMPASTRADFLGAFRRMPRARVYWRIGTPTLGDAAANDTVGGPPEVPENVNLTTYLPQNDLLASKATRVLVTNGGMHSIMEALAHGVPMVGVPLFGADYHNLRKVEQKGLAIIVHPSNLTADSLHSAIRQLLDNPRYKLAAERAKKSFNDRPVNALDTAIYWIEYVGRNHGARLFKPDQPPISLLQQTLCDLLGIIVVSFLIAFALAKYVTKSGKKTTDSEAKTTTAKKSTKKIE